MMIGKFHGFAALALTVGLLIGCSSPTPTATEPAATEPAAPQPTVTVSPTTQPTVTPLTATEPAATEPAPVEPTAPVAETPAPEGGAGGAQEPANLPDTGMAVVQNVDVRILESFPVQVQAVVTGYLPDGCTTITSVEAVNEGTAFRIRMTTDRPADAMCTMAIINFEQVVPLDVAELPAGSYQVVVNDLSVDFALPDHGAAAVPQPAAPEAGAYPVVETATAFVMAQVDVTIYDAPMTDGVAIGLIAGGQMARVTGASPDGAWWRVICPDDTVGDCWVSAAPDLTAPASPPN